MTAYAAESLGDVVDPRLPEAGSRAEAGERCGRISSPIAVSKLRAPASGRVLEVNTVLARDPGAISAAPCNGRPAVPAARREHRRCALRRRRRRAHPRSPPMTRPTH
ncbi:hypothetical protein ABZV75_37840 [Streptomyces flaveolus]|uniref:hypothetical protein n=1 Tax=Streptomyces flaveolus TaxID=67297 RepID=UPI0033A94A02